MAKREEDSQEEDLSTSFGHSLYKRAWPLDCVLALDYRIISISMENYVSRGKKFLIGSKGSL